MKPAPFDYVRSDSVEDALAALRQYGDRAKLLAGGQSLVPMMNFRLVAPEVLIDISRIRSMQRIDADDGHLTIGAGTTHTTILASDTVRGACPLLAAAYAHVSHHAIRNRGTIGGNICQHDPASEVPLVLALMGAVMTVVGPDGQRELPADEFFVDMMETAVRDDEILTEIRIPRQPATEGWGFAEMATRKGDYAIASAGCRLSVADGRFRDVRVGITGGGARIKRMASVEQALEGREASAATIDSAAAIAARDADPSADVQSDEAYKRDLIRALCRRALVEAHGRATGRA